MVLTSSQNVADKLVLGVSATFKVVGYTLNMFHVQNVKTFLSLGNTVK